MALEIVARWAAPKPAPPGWIFCRRCGEPNPSEQRYWAPRRQRLCVGCVSDEAYGIWPQPKRWCEKNRWTKDGLLERRCAGCRQWKLATEYSVNSRNGVTGRQAKQLHSRCRKCNTGMRSKDRRERPRRNRERRQRNRINNSATERAA